MLEIEVPAGLLARSDSRPTPLSAVDIEHEDFEWLRAYLQRESSETTPISDTTAVGMIVGRKHKSHHSSSHSSTSGDYSTCDSPTEEHRTINSDSEGSRETEGPAKRRKVGWTSTEDLVILTSVRKLGTQWPRIASQLPGRTADAVTPPLLLPTAPRSPGPPLSPPAPHATQHPVSRSPSEPRSSLGRGPAARSCPSPLLAACGRFATGGTASRRPTLWATARRAARRWMLCFSPRACRG